MPDATILTTSATSEDAELWAPGLARSGLGTQSGPGGQAGSPGHMTWLPICSTPAPALQPWEWGGGGVQGASILSSPYLPRAHQCPGLWGSWSHKPSVPHWPLLGCRDSPLEPPGPTPSESLKNPAKQVLKWSSPRFHLLLTKTQRERGSQITRWVCRNPQAPHLFLNYGLF